MASIIERCTGRLWLTMPITPQMNYPPRYAAKKPT